MNKTTALKTPSPRGRVAEPAGKPDDSKNYRREFFAAVIDMSWQMALVVLVPVIGGYELDNALDTLPALTIVGFLMAMAGMAAVVWRQLQLFSPSPLHDDKRTGS